MTRPTEKQGIPPRVHLVGIGGAHMSAIARILLSWGHEISGSDLRASPVTETLKALGARVYIGAHDAANLGGPEQVDLLVTTSAAQTNNPEIEEAKRRSVPVIKRADMVARLMEGKTSVCVAGSHGKSTTSGMVAYILAQAGRDPTYLIGADVAALGHNAAPGKGPHIVVEADEYDRAFLSYRPSVAVVLNVEPDHLDYYKTWEALQEAFEGFVSNVAPRGSVVLCADSEGAMDLRTKVAPGVTIETYSLRHHLRQRTDAAAGWFGRLLRDANGSSATQRFEVIRYGETLGEFSTQLPGTHMVSNCLAAIIACSAVGLTPDEIKGPLSRYTGVGRRFQKIGEVGGITVMDDYAHHPTEIETLAAAARQRFPGRRIVALFQPHTYARTRYLLDGFKKCFGGFDRVIILETYAAREAIADGMTGEQLAPLIERPQAGYAPTFGAAADVVAGELEPGDVFFTVGAGDVDIVGPMVLERLEAREEASR